jgi:small-conductance mechanosensitive channel
MNRYDRILDHDFIRPETVYGAIFYGILFLAGAFLVARLVSAAFYRAIKRDTHSLMDRTVVIFLGRLSQLFVYAFAFLIYAHLIPALQHIGTAWLASVGVVSVVIGLAAQQALGNLIAGISLLFYRPFKLGDRVQVAAPTGTETGVVEILDLGYTVLRTGDNRRIVVPNSVMANQVTINHSMTDARVICTVPLGIGYGADIDRVRAVLIEVMKANPRVREVVGCRVAGLGAFSVDLSLLFWCDDAGVAAELKSELLEAIKKRFDAEGIEIPYPTSNVILRNAAPGPPAGGTRA